MFGGICIYEGLDAVRMESRLSAPFFQWSVIFDYSTQNEASEDIGAELREVHHRWPWRCPVI